MTTKQYIWILIAAILGAGMAYTLFRPNAVTESQEPVSCLQGCQDSCLSVSEEEVTKCQQACNSLC